MQYEIQILSFQTQYVGFIPEYYIVHETKTAKNQNS
jgi:hypothetical protein